MTNASCTVIKTVTYENDNCSKPGNHFTLLLFAGGIPSFLKRKKLPFIGEVWSFVLGTLQ